MGKKQRAKNKKVSASGKPLVSICTPTYNRRIFIPTLIKKLLSTNLSSTINGMDYY